MNSDQSEPINWLKSTLLSARKHFVTGRNEVVVKVIFLHLSVILFTGGVSASVHAGIPPPRADTSREQTPPWEQTPPRSRHPQSRHPLGAEPPPGADTLPGSRPPRADTPRSRPPREQTPPRAGRPPREQTPPRAGRPPRSRHRHTVNERPVRILLECILVYI